MDEKIVAARKKLEQYQKELYRILEGDSNE